MNDLNFFSFKTSRSEPGVALASFWASVKEADRQNETMANMKLACGHLHSYMSGCVGCDPYEKEEVGIDLKY